MLPCDCEVVKQRSEGVRARFHKNQSGKNDVLRLLGVPTFSLRYLEVARACFSQRELLVPHPLTLVCYISRNEVRRKDDHPHTLGKLEDHHLAVMCAVRRDLGREGSVQHPYNPLRRTVLDN